jgi:hypothetical protein
MLLLLNNILKFQLAERRFKEKQEKNPDFFKRLIDSIHSFDNI